MAVAAYTPEFGSRIRSQPAVAGERYGSWTVLQEARPRWTPGGSKVRIFICRCDCGSEKPVEQRHLRGGTSRSCGCSLVTLGKQSGLTGRTKRREHKIWYAMMRRCYRPQDASYDRYGGRGITVCERWHDFDNFLSDMGPRPTARHSIDRIENDKGYEPGNCRWATHGEQARNKVTTIMLTARGETMCASDWATRVGLAPNVVVRRLRRGWSHEDAIFRPSQRRASPSV